MKIFLAALFTLVGLQAQADHGSQYAGGHSQGYSNPYAKRQHYYFDWGRGQNGWGYCYQFDRWGNVMNYGRPVSNYNCERVSPSFYDWARGQNNRWYCYQFTPYRAVMNEGRAQPEYYCRY